MKERLLYQFQNIKIRNTFKLRTDIKQTMQWKAKRLINLSSTRLLKAGKQGKKSPYTKQKEKYQIILLL